MQYATHIPIDRIHSLQDIFFPSNILIQSKIKHCIQWSCLVSMFFGLFNCFALSFVSLTFFVRVHFHATFFFIEHFSFQFCLFFHDQIPVMDSWQGYCLCANIVVSASCLETHNIHLPLIDDVNFNHSVKVLSVQLLFFSGKYKIQRNKF